MSLYILRAPVSMKTEQMLMAMITLKTPFSSIPTPLGNLPIVPRPVCNSVSDNTKVHVRGGGRGGRSKPTHSVHINEITQSTHISLNFPIIHSTWDFHFHKRNRFVYKYCPGTLDSDLASRDLILRYTLNLQNWYCIFHNLVWRLM